jgi:hypothetical protein
MPSICAQRYNQALTLWILGLYASLVCLQSLTQIAEPQRSPAKSESEVRLTTGARRMHCGDLLQLEQIRHQLVIVLKTPVPESARDVHLAHQFANSAREVVLQRVFAEKFV